MTDRRRPTSSELRRRSLTDRLSAHAARKSSKKFFTFSLTSGAYVFRLLPSSFTRSADSSMSTLSRHVSAPRGAVRSCKGWPQEAALRMLMNNLDPDVAERPDELIVYGGSGRAARSWEAFDAIVDTLRRLEDDETLVVQSGKPVAVFRTHPWSPRVIIANALLVPAWANWDTFRDLEDRGLTMYGQMTAGSWID